MSTATFFPHAVYAQPGLNDTVPRVLVSPPRYVQGPGVLAHAGRYLSVLGAKRFGVLASSRGHRTQAGELAVALEGDGCETVAATFDGECSLEEIEPHAAALADEALDCLVAVGGGKCVDAGKSIAHRLGVPLVVVPTLASNDAPCSALSVLYTPEGVVAGAEFFPQSPVFVIVDTATVSEAPERYLVAGMGDALATWFEARVCMRNVQARNMLGARPTRTACAMGELCADTLFESGTKAAAAVRDNAVNASLEDVVEANTLLSGVGFESGGLAGAHGYAQGYTVLPEVEHNYLHGEMVAMGTLAQLMLEGEAAEAKRVASFFASVGLPVHLGQLGLAPSQTEALDAVVQGTLTFQPLANLPFAVDADNVLAALLAADELGRDVAAAEGDAAYRRLQAGG